MCEQLKRIFKKDLGRKTTEGADLHGNRLQSGDKPDHIEGTWIPSLSVRVGK